MPAALRSALGGYLYGAEHQGHESAIALQILVWLFSFLSNVLVDPSTMPEWLGVIAQWNPLSATTSATCELFMNLGWQNSSWIAEYAVLMANVWPLLFIATFPPHPQYHRSTREWAFHNP